MIKGGNVMRKILSLVIAFLIMLNLGLNNVSADSQEVKVYIDGVKINFDVSPVIDNGRTLVPIRAISEYLKYEVNWNNEKQEAEIENDGNIMVIGVNKTKYTKNGEIKEMDVPAKLINGRTLVPVRLISESFGCKVDWDNNTFSVYIKTQLDEAKQPAEKVWTPDFSDYSGGSINNPIGPNIAYADHKYAVQGKGIEYLEYQPTPNSQPEKIRLNSIRSYSKSEMEDYIKKYVDKSESQDWKAYSFEITYLEGTNNLNVNELLSANNFLKLNGEKYTDKTFIVYMGKRYDSDTELDLTIRKDKYKIILFVENNDETDGEPVLKISYDFGNNEKFMYVNPYKKGYDGLDEGKYTNDSSVKLDGDIINPNTQAYNKDRMKELQAERSRLVSQLNSALASNMGRESSYTKAIRDKIEDIDKEISKLQ